MHQYSIYAFADEADSFIPGQIEAMLRNGLKGLEIRNVDGTNITDISLEKARQVRKQLDDQGLITWSVGSPIGKQKITNDFAPELERFKHTLELAHELGAGNIRLFSFFIPKEKDPAIYRNQVIDRVGQFVEAARGSNILICHENEKGIYGDIAERCLDLYQQLPELKGIFDPANFIQSGDDTLCAWQLLKNHIHYLHIKDALCNGDVVPAGQGAGNVAYIVREFLAQGGQSMTIEPHLRVFAGLKELEENGDIGVIGKQFSYPSAGDAFDAACNAIKDILEAL
jgi:sugar phosphate isomerase/epimerase